MCDAIYTRDSTETILPHDKTGFMEDSLTEGLSSKEGFPPKEGLPPYRFKFISR